MAFKKKKSLLWTYCVLVPVADTGVEANCFLIAAYILVGQIISKNKTFQIRMYVCCRENRMGDGDTLEKGAELRIATSEWPGRLPGEVTFGLRTGRFPHSEV